MNNHVSLIWKIVAAIPFVVIVCVFVYTTIVSRREKKGESYNGYADVDVEQ